MGAGSGGRGRVGVVRVDVIEELKFLGKFTKKLGGSWGVGGWVGGRVGLVGGQGGCERRIKVFVKIQKTKKKFFFFFGGGGSGGGGGRVGVGGGGGVRYGCERRIKVFVKIQKKYIFFFFFWGGSGWGVGLVGWVG